MFYPVLFSHLVFSLQCVLQPGNGGQRIGDGIRSLHLQFDSGNHGDEEALEAHLIFANLELTSSQHAVISWAQNLKELYDML